MAAFRTVCRTEEVPEGEGKTVVVGHKLIAVFRHGGKFFAIDDTCPHMGSSLSGGWVDQGIVTCPWHAWRFRLADGAWADNPRIKIGCYPVRVVNDEIQLDVDSPPSTPETPT
jgi:nitrite reductase (NADH) small subunit/3-phenylpropionate/trans-cinnamate dioxygenase ferredoxin subunit